MRSFNLVRSICCTGLALGLLAGVAATSAQDTTPEPTEDMMMTQVMSMQGACPQDAAATMMMNSTGMVTETPMMSGTEDMSMMTPAATMDMSMSTPETNAQMMGTEEVTGAKCLFGKFSGSAEVPGPGATGASGFVFVTISPTTGDVCYEEAVSGITLPAKATHIHVNSAGLSGDVVVPFPVAPDAQGMASGCTTITVPGLAQAIANNPAQYYVNVHTSDFPNGAARAQLSAWDASMMSSLGMIVTPEMGTNMNMTTTPGTNMTTPIAPESTQAASG